MPAAHTPNSPAARPCRPGRAARQAAAAAALLATFPIAYALTPFLLRDLVPLCPFRCATGQPCPLCGLTRAVALASHGRWLSATRMNPLWPLFAALTFLFASLLMIDCWSGRDSAARLLRTLSDRWPWIFAGLLAFGIVRIVVLQG